jgi:hypothetical protein
VSGHFGKRKDQLPGMSGVDLSVAKTESAILNEPAF